VRMRRPEGIGQSSMQMLHINLGCTIPAREGATLGVFFLALCAADALWSCVMASNLRVCVLCQCL
jgi:hypothetical protein